MLIKIIYHVEWVSTYISRNEKAKALQVLARIPQDGASNIAFTEIYEAVVYAQPDLSPNAEQMIRAYADSQGAQTAIHAQNILHKFFGEAEIRNSAPVGNHAAKQALAAAESKGVLHLYPNPTKDLIRLQWKGDWSEGQVASLQIYHPNGKMLREHLLNTPEASIELESLPMGTYFCRFSIDGMLQATHKLIIIH
ncbi:MAG: T9SS type A sorting domain-containing protein [Chitinophagales bacterium]